MSRILFTIGADLYELTPRVKQYFIEQTTNDATLDAWFDGQRLYHEYVVNNGDESTVETDWVDVVETFQTLPREAREQLRDAGAEPVIAARNGLYTTDSSGTVDLQRNA